MALLRKHISIGLMALAALAAAWVLYLLLPANHGPFRAIPEQTALVLECNGLLKARKLTTQIPAQEWSDLSSAALIQQCFNDADLLFRLFKHQPELLRALAQAPAIAAFSLHPADSLHALFAWELSQPPDLDKLLKNNEISSQWANHIFHNHSVIQVPFGTDQYLEIACSDRILLFSRKAVLVEAALAQLEKNRHWWTQRPLMDKLTPAPLRVHFRPEVWAEHSRASMRAGGRDLPDILARNVAWGGWAWDGSRLDCLFETKGFLADISQWGQTSAGMAAQLLPNNTTFLIRAGIRKPNAFFAGIGTGIHPDFERFVLPWVGNEAILATTEPLSKDLATDRLLLLSLRDSAGAVQALQEYGRERGLRPSDSGPYQMFELMGFQQGSLLEPLTGKDAAFQNPVVALVSGYVVFAPDRAAMEVLLDKYLVGQTLSAREDFLLWKQKNPAPGQVECLLNTAHLNPILAALSTFQCEKELPSPGWIGASMTAERKKQLRVNWSCQPITQLGRQPELHWKTSLKSPINGRPMVASINTDQTVVLVQDRQNILYCLDAANGRLLWSRVLPESILSEVIAVDYFKSGSKCLMFNTPEALYLLDQTGRDVQGFPFRWPEKAINSVAVVDFDHDRRYSFFATCANGKCYGFDPFGRPLAGWNGIPVGGDMHRPLLHFQHDGKDFLALLTDNGVLSVYGRDGRLRFAPPTLQGVFEASLFADSKASEPCLYAANTAGEMFVCDLKGGITTYEAGKSGSLTLFGQIQGDARYEWVQWDGKNLRIGGFPGEKKVIYSSIAIKERPDQWFLTANQVLGAVDTKSKRIWMFDQQGNPLPGFPLGGEAQFERTQSTGIQLLVTSVNQEIWVYRL